MASSSQPSRRLAPPSLFVGPPSTNASDTALAAKRPPPPTTADRESSRLQNQLRPPPSPSSSSSSSSQASSDSPPAQLRQQSATQPQAPITPTLHIPRSDTGPRTTRQPSATTQTWRALQSTLEEVELNALSSASVFGAEHSRALEELRKAQVELARAWARGEGEDAGSAEPADDDMFGDAGAQIGGRTEPGLGVASGPSVSKDKQTGKTGSAAGGGGGAAAAAAADLKDDKTRLEQETENDILLARRRRLANDRYFERVNGGVVDVVARLEVVARKMGGVEMESQEIWGDEADSFDGASAEEPQAEGTSRAE